MDVLLAYPLRNEAKTWLKRSRKDRCFQDHRWRTRKLLLAAFKPNKKFSVCGRNKERRRRDCRRRPQHRLLQM